MKERRGGGFKLIGPITEVAVGVGQKHHVIGIN